MKQKQKTLKQKIWKSIYNFFTVDNEIKPKEFLIMLVICCIILFILGILLE